MFNPGDTVRIDCPGHDFHGRAVEVVRDDPAFELGYEDASMIAQI